MAEESITKLESVIAGIRGYIGEQLGELEGELGAARGAVSDLGEQLAARKASIETLEASRELLIAKLGELEGAVAETQVLAQAQESREAAGNAVAEEIVAAAGGDAVVGALPSGTTGKAKATPRAKKAAAKPAAKATDKAADKAGDKPAEKLTPGQLGVLSFLEATPGVHKVSEIATAVHGADADNAALQAVRRALSALTEAGRAVKSTQSGTAFYSADAEQAAPAEAAAAPAEPAPAAEKPATEQATAKKTAAKKAVTKKAVAKQATAKQAKPTKAVAKKAATTTAAAKPAATRPARKSAAKAPAAAETVAAPAAKGSDEPSAPARSRKAAAKSTAGSTVRKAAAKKAATASAKAAEAPVEKNLRADRTKIVAVLLSASEPQSAGEVSRTVMGTEWKSSDATNFRNVLKSMVAEGVVAEHLGDNNRVRYTVAASS
jgi:Fe2+ or Zn2+ uptake regulation protein